MKRLLSYLSLATLCIGLAPACSDDTAPVTKKDLGRKDRGARDLGQQPDQGEIPDGPKLADQSKPDQFTFFTDKGPAGDLPKTADKGKADQPAGAPANDTCAKAEVLTWNGTPITRTVDTTNAADDLDLGASSCTGDVTDGNDVFYKITLPAGKYTLNLTGAYDGALYVLTSCAASSCVTGSDNYGTPTNETIVLTVTASTTYIIGVDAWDPGEADVYTLKITAGGTSPDGGPKPDVAKTDGPKVDAGPKPDGPKVDGPAGLAKIVITEIMANPTAKQDPDGEYFEVYNAGTATVNLKGWKISEAPPSTQSHTIATDVLVPAGQYKVLAAVLAPASNGGVPAAYGYGTTFTLANAADEIYLYDDKSNLIDSVTWDASWGFGTTAVGVSLSLKNPTLDNSVFANWCLEKTAWTGSAGDKGTPGAAAGCP